MKGQYNYKNNYYNYYNLVVIVNNDPAISYNNGILLKYSKL